jgi:hypothetical protein
MRAWHHLVLVFREQHARIVQATFNRAMLKKRGPIERIATLLVLAQMPKIRDDRVGGGRNKRGRLDAPRSTRSSGRSLAEERLR